MKTACRLLFLLSLTFADPFALSAADEKPETELTQKMDRMSAAFRKLRRQAADPAKNADSLAQVAILRETAEASAKLEPAMVATIPAERRAQFLAGYRAKMDELITAIGRLETALKANENEAAVKIIADLSALQKSGHKDYQAEDKP